MDAGITRQLVRILNLTATAYVVHYSFYVFYY